MATKARSNSRARARKDAVSLLEHDHETVRKLLGQLDKTTSRGQRRREELLERVAMEIEAHAAIEEEIFYPAFRERGENEEDEKLFFEAAEEHQLVHWVLPELKATDPGSELFSARAKVLKDLIEHHAEEEESEILPRARKLMSREELEDLGRRLAQRKSEILGSRGTSNGGSPRRGAAAARSRAGMVGSVGVR